MTITPDRPKLWRCSWIFCFPLSSSKKPAFMKRESPSPEGLKTAKHQQTSEMNWCSSNVFLHWGWYERRTTVHCTPRISSLGLQRGSLVLICLQSKAKRWKNRPVCHHVSSWEKMWKPIEKQTFWVHIKDHVCVQQSNLWVLGHAPDLTTLTWHMGKLLKLWKICVADGEFVHDTTPSFVNHLRSPKGMAKFKSSTWSSLHSPIDSSACRPVSSVAPNRSFGSINTVKMCIGIIFVCLHTVKMACSCLPICFIEKHVHKCQGTGSESITAGIGIGSVMYVFTWFSTEGPMVLWHWDLWCAARKDTLKSVPLNHLQIFNRDTYYIDRCVKQHLSPSVCDSIAIQDFQMLRWDRRLSWSAGLKWSWAEPSFSLRQYEDHKALTNLDWINVIETFRGIWSRRILGALKPEAPLDSILQCTHAQCRL